MAFSLSCSWFWCLWLDKCRPKIIEVTIYKICMGLKMRFSRKNAYLPGTDACMWSPVVPKTGCDGTSLYMWEVSVGKLDDHHYSRFNSKFKASLGCKRPCLNIFYFAIMKLLLCSSIGIKFISYCNFGRLFYT